MDTSNANKPIQPVQPYRFPNVTPTVAGLGSVNVPSGQNFGQQLPPPVVRAPFVLPQTKKKQKPKKRQRVMMAAGANDGSGDGDPNQADANKANTGDDDKAEDQMGVAETYADYMPAKLKFGAAHPDPVVETATLSSIEPNDITYDLSIPKRTITRGLLSALQLESIVYASQAHEKILEDGQRAGFLIGLYTFISIFSIKR